MSRARPYPSEVFKKKKEMKRYAEIIEKDTMAIESRYAKIIQENEVSEHKRYEDILRENGEYIFDKN